MSFSNKIRGWVKSKCEQSSDGTHAIDEVSETFSGVDNCDHNAGAQMAGPPVSFHCHNNAGAQDKTFSGVDTCVHNAGAQVEWPPVSLLCHNDAGAQDEWLSDPLRCHRDDSAQNESTSAPVRFGQISYGTHSVGDNFDPILADTSSKDSNDSYFRELATIPGPEGHAVPDRMDICCLTNLTSWNAGDRGSDICEDAEGDGGENSCEDGRSDREGDGGGDGGEDSSEDGSGKASNGEGDGGGDGGEDGGTVVASAAEAQIRGSSLDMLAEAAATAQDKEINGHDNAESRFMDDSDARSACIQNAESSAMGDSDAKTGSINDAGAGTQAVPVCTMCGNESGIVIRVCPNCRAPICHTCASISGDMLSVVKPFLEADPCAAWEALHCLNCQSVEDFDGHFVDCLEDVRQAIHISMKCGKATQNCQALWYHAGLLFGEGGPLSGVFLPPEFRQCAEDMLKHEATFKSLKSSIGPWEAEAVGLTPELILTISRTFAKPYNLKQNAVLKPTDGKPPKIIVISADWGKHPTAHLMVAELLEMGKSEKANVFLLCVATTKRLKSLSASSSKGRAALQDAFGERFVPLGHLNDKQIAKEIKARDPQIIYLAGFHQDGDRIGVLRDLASAVIVQGVAHASTSGSKGVHRLLCNEFVLTKEIQEYYSEKPLFIDGPFLPNSFRTLYGEHVEWLSQLRNVPHIRSRERENRGMPRGHIIANIAKPNRLDQRFFDMVFAIIEANADTFLMLIDHGYPAFRLRIEALFKKRGLLDRIVFLPFQELENGELHSVLALVDVCIDSLVCNGHTAGHDILWANGILITVPGTRLATRIGADLLRHFGCPENICDDTAAAVARVNSLLQNPSLLSAARLKADHCRATSKMYDNTHRAEIVIEALLRAYDETRQNQRQQPACSASETQLSDTDVQSICAAMEGLGISVQGHYESTSRFAMFAAQFRNCPVVIKMGQDPEDVNPVFRELVARDGRPGGFRKQLFAPLLQFNENQANGEEGELDAIQIAIPRGKVFAVIEESTEYRAKVLFDELAEGWRGKPSQGTVNGTAVLLLAVIKLLSALHARGRAYGEDPRTFKLSMLKNGYGAEAVAFVLYKGQPYALLLGDAELLMDPLTVSNQGQHRRSGGTSRSAGILLKSQCPAARKSLRRVGSNASIPFSQMKAMLMNPQEAASSHSIIEQAKRDDLRKAAKAVLNMICDKDVLETKWQGSTHIFRAWLDTLSDNEFGNVTGVPRRDQNLLVSDGFCSTLMKETSRLKDLFELLQRMLGDEAPDAKTILASNPFPDITVPFNAYPEGLDSAPAVVRNDLQACPKLMQEIQQQVLHYYVAGKTLTWKKEQKKLIATWLVIRYEPEKKRFYRSLFSAAEGKEGDLAAIYHCPLEKNAALTSYISPVHQMTFPGTKITMDGTPRSAGDIHKAVASSNVAQFANSCLNERGQQYRQPNCAREWSRGWTSLNSQKSLETIDEVSLGLRLLKQVGMYEELHYWYNWGKYDKTPEKEDDLLAALLHKPARKTRP